MKNIINKLHKLNFLGKIFHTLDYCLQRELKNCKTVLDLGCGPSSPLQYCKNIKYSVGVEMFHSYLKKSKEKQIHSEYLEKKIEGLDFPENSFDAVVMIEVLEHLSKKEGKRILKKAERWAKEKIVVSTPNGFIKQKAVDNNPLQEHLSGWNIEEIKKMGFKCHGLAGLKFLRQEVQNDTMGDDLMTSIRFCPRFFWFIVASFSQIITYFLPRLAFELFSIKKIK